MYAPLMNENVNGKQTVKATRCCDTKFSDLHAVAIVCAAFNKTHTYIHYATNVTATNRLCNRNIDCMFRHCFTLNTYYSRHCLCCPYIVTKYAMDGTNRHFQFIFSVLYAQVGRYNDKKNQKFIAYRVI